LRDGKEGAPQKTIPRVIVAHRDALVTVNTEELGLLQRSVSQRSLVTPKKHHKPHHQPLTRDKRHRHHELPLPEVDEVWDVMSRMKGGLHTYQPVVEIVELFHLCKLAGLSIELARFPGLWPAREYEPEDVSAGEVAHLCLMLLDDTEEELTYEEVRRQIDEVKEECRAMEFKDLYISEDDMLNFGHFKRLINFLSDLMGIDHSYILGTFMYLCTGRFELPDLLAAIVIRVLGKKQRHAAADQDDDPSLKKDKKHDKKERSKSPFPGCAVSDVHAILDQRFSNIDWSRLCYNCQVVDAHHGITFSRCSETFVQTVKHMGKLFKGRIRKRPILEQDGEK
jgi:hypothetical protein